MTAEDPPETGRRTVLKSAAGVATGAALAGQASAQETTTSGTIRPDWGGWLDGVDGGFEDVRGQDEVRVTVGASGNGGNFAFEPAGLWVDPGTTVIWEWNGQGGAHNVHSQSGPSYNSGNPVVEAGTTFEYTYESGGISTYQCDPHATLGMKGAVAVGDDVPTRDIAAGGGGGGITIPGGSVGLAIMGAMMAAIGAGAIAILGADVFSRGLRTPPAYGEAQPEEELGHDEYEPLGTAGLIVIYFLILVGMWIFVYFIEFLGNGPTVIG